MLRRIKRKDYATRTLIVGSNYYDAQSGNWNREHQTFYQFGASIHLFQYYNIHQNILLLFLSSEFWLNTKLK